jgi:hypothetical protein
MPSIEVVRAELVVVEKELGASVCRKEEREDLGASVCRRRSLGAS